MFPAVQGHVPYFCEKNPFVKPGEEEDDVIVPSKIVSALFMAVWFVLCPLYDTAGWSIGNVLLQAALAAIFIEGNSGLFHIVFDNEKINHIPIIGPVAKDFQIHHVQPAAITKLNVFEFMQQIHLPGFAIIPWQAYFTRSCVSLRPFWFFTILCLHLMFLAHRWSHMLPSANYKIVTWAQKNGLLLSMKQHIQHHKTYDCNYSIFTGWSNCVLNILTKQFGSESFAYLPIYATYCHIPTLVFVAATYLV